ncbi:ABC-three component system protein [Nocardia arizonensis]|uniref:ABC-three component system protein n=1 Tax=Nocardia arizonensis TaxID=1141647 RepID=UPI0006D1703B|nr:ABC-three component system protein [Nocardia arizonensis]
MGELPILLTANWLDWYYARHQRECVKSGVPFEDYVAAVLGRFHDDYLNPAPTGRFGDGGCDGLAESGSIAYACYGQRPGRDAERELANKIEKDFARAFDQWPSFHTWRFVTNVPVGPLASRVATKLQRTHGPHSGRPLTVRIFTTEKLWTDIVSKLGMEVLNEVFPGAPGVANVELADLIPLLDALGTVGPVAAPLDAVLPVPANKMDFNELADASRAEFNYGRLLAPQIDLWYAQASEPGLLDAHGERFRGLYEQARTVTADPGEILERLYVAVAGPNVRMDGTRANAAFAVVSYFFDSCHIFEVPPGPRGATSDVEVPDALAH